MPLRILLIGASGSIGRATALALVKRGYQVVCLIRSQQTALQKYLAETEIRWCELTDMDSIRRDGFRNESFDAVISCLASRTGLPEDAWAIDYAAHLKILEIAKQVCVKQFVLLSAICVQKPMLEFQHAKLAFEKKLIESGLVFSIVRPTAFFKSLSGQLRRVMDGKPFLIFGNGKLTACKPIGDDDLADYIAGCLELEDRKNRILPIGGPGPAITPYEQGMYLFKLLNQTPRFRRVPPGLLKIIARVLQLLGVFFPVLADKAELARIGHYYASESMLVWNEQSQCYDADSTPSHGTQSLFEAYQSWIKSNEMPDRGDHAVF